MNPAYELFQKAAETNKQLYTVLRFACQCSSATTLTLNTFESLVAYLAGQVKDIQIITVTDLDKSVFETYSKLSAELDVNLTFTTASDKIYKTDLLFIDTPAEGNFRAMELSKYAEHVNKYIILSNTVKHAHAPSPTIKLPENVQPIGLIHGINHFLQSNDQWFILEHDDVDPGVTVLIRKENATL